MAKKKAASAASVLMKQVAKKENKQEINQDPGELVLCKVEIEQLKNENAHLAKTRTGWMVTAIILFALFVITLGLKLA
ncbi:MAG: hypothetical protein ACI32F_07785 [Allobaculum sp.]